MVCDVVRADIPVATDKWSVDTLLTEELENTEHHRPPSHNLVLYPRNLLILTPGTHTLAVLPSLPPLPFLAGHPCGDIMVVCVGVGVILVGTSKGACLSEVSLWVGEVFSRPCEDCPGTGPITCSGRPPGNMDIATRSIG